MSLLVPMPPDAFRDFADQANAGYAQDHVKAGRWSAGEALAKATAEFAQLLPQGMATPDHHFYEVVDPSSGERVGHVWFAVVGSGEARAGYVFNIAIRPRHRRQGHARHALLALEEIVSGMGLHAMRLNVFGHNAGAEALYRSLGYQVASTVMRKPLSPVTAPPPATSS